MKNKKVLTYKGYKAVIWQVNDRKWLGRASGPGDIHLVLVGVGYLEIIEEFHSQVEECIKHLERKKAELFDKLMRNQV